MDNEANISDVIQLLRFSGEALSFGIKQSVEQVKP